MRLGVIAFTSMLVFAMAGCSGPSNMVDGKAIVITPEGHTCYLLEIEREDSQGNELSESYQCVTKGVFDKNEVEEVFVP